ncbi:hypothetical protein ACIRF8_12695 [Streptomyces sp. NPDC102406]|uniref:hypothetical protein n=1 Tax=Streptomyces sp. NPDC102406 TaxID=3366171 RepID=UPI00381473A5
MIVHDLATALPAAIGRAILTVATTAGATALLLVGITAIATSLITGAWPRRRTPTPVEYDEAA